MSIPDPKLMGITRNLSFNTFNENGLISKWNQITCPNCFSSIIVSPDYQWGIEGSQNDIFPVIDIQFFSLV